MKPLGQKMCDELIDRIVGNFGEGALPVERYVFDVITRTPAGFTDAHVPGCELLSEVQNERFVWLVFDPNPQNLAAVLTLLRRLKIEDASGLEMLPAELPQFFDDMDCDFYAMTVDGAWLAAASHSDQICDGQRMVWRAKRSAHV